MAVTVFQPAWLLARGQLLEGASLVVDADGTVLERAPADAQVVPLPNRLLLPGFVNAHSHAFQRVIRSRTEFIARGHDSDDFWSWREAMYAAAHALTPEQVYTASRQAFVEMALAGVTTVCEFHYLHHQSDGREWADPHELSRQVIRAARDVGLRIVLLRVMYARAGFQVAENPRQKRFIDSTASRALELTHDLQQVMRADPRVSVGLAPHSVRAVPEAWLREVAQHWSAGPLHMHVSEQPAEIRACLAEHQLRPVELLQRVGLLGPRFTAVHAIHLSNTEIAALGSTHSNVCACPSTERNLGDGIVPADSLRQAGATVSLGSDSHAHIDLLDDAHQLEGHLRLARLRRNVFHGGEGDPNGLGRALLDCLTVNGARAAGVTVGALTPGEPADFVTIDLHHPTLAGVPSSSLLTGVTLSAASAAIRDVSVAGRLIVRDGQHALAEPSRRDFTALIDRLVR